MSGTTVKPASLSLRDALFALGGIGFGVVIVSPLLHILIWVVIGLVVVSGGAFAVAAKLGVKV